MSSDSLSLVENDPSLDFIIPTHNDYSNFTNIMFIDKSISQYQTFVDSANLDTLPIVYSRFSNVSTLNTFLSQNFTHIERLCFAFHGFSASSVSPSQNLFQDDLFFHDSDLLANVTEYSKNVSFIKNLISQYTVKNIDYLGCNLLKFPNWKSYFELIASDSSVIVGASEDETGNLKYGGDWILENTNENVKLVYFSSGIDTVTGVLVDYYATVDTYPGSNIPITYTYTLSGTDATLSALMFQWAVGVNLVIPSTFVDDSSNEYDVVAIGDNVFFGKQLSGSLTIPNSVTSIGDHAFKANAELDGTLTLSNTLESIGITAFKDSPFTGALTIPGSVTSIGTQAFDHQYSTSSFTSIIFLDRSLDLVIPSTFMQNNSALNSITLVDNITEISAFAFAGTTITEVTIPDSVTTIGGSAFGSTAHSTTSLTTVYMKTTNGLGLTVPSVGTVSFYSATVSIFLHETIYTVVAVADYTLSGASNITVIALDNSVTSVGDNTFADMGSLTTIQVNADHTIWGSAIGSTINIGGVDVSVEQHLVCFDESTLILCPSGYVPVKNLKLGDSVVTYKHGNRKINLIRVTKIILNEEISKIVNPYKKQGYAKHMFRMKKSGDMTDDLLVTGRHGILVDDLSSCSYFVDKIFDTRIDDKILLDVGLCSRFERETECKEYTIYQIELEGDLPRYGIYANGVLMESLLSVYSDNE